MRRRKQYLIKEISNDGLLKDPKRYDDPIFYDYETEEEAWQALEKEWEYWYGKLKSASPYYNISYVVIEEWVVSPTDTGED